MVKVAVVDSGGRGNAIAYCFSKSPKVEKVYVLPGNAGSYLFDECVAVSEIGSIRNIEETFEFVKKKDVSLTFVGPEAPISKGIGNLFEENGLSIIAPTKEAAVLETSKCWTKDYLKRIGVPVPNYKNFDDPEKGKDYAKKFYDENPGKNLVVKADGIAEGKGAFVCNSLEDTLNAIDIVTGEKFNEKYNNAGRRFEIEERLYGNELSFFAITDGKNVVDFGTAKDYKRRFERGDHPFIRQYFNGINPNTGGMGSYSPEPVGEEFKEIIMEKIVEPVVKNLNHKYKGILHFVLMKEENENIPKVLEINVRDGDPEAQSRLPRLLTDIYEISKAILEGNLDEINIKWEQKHCVAVCAISGPLSKETGGIRRRVCEGYPGEHHTNQKIYIIPKENPEKYRYPMKIKEEWGAGKNMSKYLDENCLCFCNGVAFDEKDKFVTSGGRVLTIVGKGNTREEAIEIAYNNINKIWFNGMAFRKDIGL